MTILEVMRVGQVLKPESWGVLYMLFPIASLFSRQVFVKGSLLRLTPAPHIF